MFIIFDDTCRDRIFVPSVLKARVIIFKIRFYYVFEVGFIPFTSLGYFV